ncbi:hypothetical protein MMA231_04356 (plasmid) [Asticcacaulis sp. MM231]|uniref:hypothetical protein n=1 Tax=Asticcacaulis sp. MM231 TaxID=3157666 RepID=UPI0032D5B014
MEQTTLFVGLDVHKKTIAVAQVDGAAGADVRFYGTHLSDFFHSASFFSSLSFYSPGDCQFNTIKKFVLNLGENVASRGEKLVPGNDKI